MDEETAEQRRVDVAAALDLVVTEDFVVVLVATVEADLLDEAVTAVAVEDERVVEDGGAYTTGNDELVALNTAVVEAAAATGAAVCLGSNPHPSARSIGYSQAAIRFISNPPLLSSLKLSISSCNSSSVAVTWKCTSAVASCCVVVMLGWC